jgi:hypothetical protein
MESFQLYGLVDRPSNSAKRQIIVKQIMDGGHGRLVANPSLM